MENKKNQIVVGQIIIGLILVGIAIFEFSTFYFTNKYLIPYQQTNFLRGLYEIGIAPIIFGIIGIRQLYSGIQGKPVERKTKQNLTRNYGKKKDGVLTYIVKGIIILTFFFSFEMLGLFILEAVNPELVEKEGIFFMFLLLSSAGIGILVALLVIKILDKTIFFRWLNNIGKK